MLLFVIDTLTKSSFSKFSMVIPLTYENDIARRAVSNLSIFLSDWIMLIIISLTWFIIGCITFGISIKYAKKNGLLGSLLNKRT